jgi:[ribosomal protein S5]-alanine N-acetyltransferase
MGLSGERTCHEARRANDSWLRPWDASSPEEQTHSVLARPAVAVVRRYALAGACLTAVNNRLETRRGTAAFWAIWYDGQFAGQMTVFRITWGPLRSAEVGYWVDQRFAGRGIAPTALAMTVDHCFRAMRLHRIEAGIQPENGASRRVMEKLGIRDEGLRAGLVYVNGAWRDHLWYGITADDVPGGLLNRWRSQAAAPRA